MNKKEPTFFGNIFGTTVKPQTVDGVLEAFRNTITDLESVAASHSGQAAEHAAVIAQREQLKAAAEAESARASGIAQKMKAIFN